MAQIDKQAALEELQKASHLMADAEQLVEIAADLRQDAERHERGALDSIASHKGDVLETTLLIGGNLHPAVTQEDRAAHCRDHWWLIRIFGDVDGFAIGDEVGASAEDGRRLCFGPEANPGTGEPAVQPRARLVRVLDGT